MKKIQLFFAAAVCFSTATIAQSNASLNLEKGQKYQIENKMETSSSTQVQGQSMESKINVTSTYNIEVKDKGANNYNLTNSISHLLMDMEMMGQQINFDSDKKEDMDGQMGTVLKDYINKPKDIEMDKTGKITSVPTDTSAAGIAQQMNFAQTGYGTQMAFLALPKNAKVGTTWTENSSEGGIDRSTNYIIKEINGNIATVSVTGTVSTKKTVQQQGMEQDIKTSGKFTGEEKVDLKSGVIQTSTTKVDVSGTVTAMGQDLPTSAKITSTTTVKSL